MASRERDDAMAGLLKRTLAGDAGVGNDCPGPDILAAYFERSLDAGETAHIELHLSECARCREELAALGRAEEAAATQAAQAPRHQPRASWIWDWRWLAPVAAVLILTAVWATRRPELTRIAERPTTGSDQAATSPPASPAPPQEKQLSPPSPIAPAPSAVPAPAKATSAAIAGGAKSQIRRDSPTAGSPPPPKPAAPGENTITAGNLHHPESGLAAQDALSKKTVAPRKTAEQNANAMVPSVSESVTVESAAPAIVMPQAAPASGAPMMAGAGRGNGVGVSGGVAAGAVAADSSKAKQERVATNSGQVQTEAEIVATNEEQLSASFIVRTPDKSILWRIGSAGFVERSGDGGLTWHGTLPKQNANYAAGSAPNAKVCWLVGNDGIILLTQAASAWQTVPPPVRTNFVAVVARDAWTATVTTADGRKFTTTNQGESWTPAK